MKKVAIFSKVLVSLALNILVHIMYTFSLEGETVLLVFRNYQNMNQWLNVLYFT